MVTVGQSTPTRQSKVHVSAELTDKLPTQAEQRVPPLSFWQLWNMNAGFLGIQFGWGLQMANTSAIFEYLGANPHQLPLLWLAAPLTGLVVQPIIGHMSDRTWGPLGRRRPYFLVGAILSSIALVMMPNASSLWMAAGLLWVLDTSANISMTPFRSFVGDLVPAEQRTTGFTVQSLLHGLGAVTASALPWILAHGLGVTDAVGTHTIPDPAMTTHTIPLVVKYSFYVGAAAFLLTVLWTVFTTDEAPPTNLEEFRASQQERRGWGVMVKEILTGIREMPATMRQLAWVQCFSWLGMFCVFLYFPPAIAHNIMGATDEGSLLYAEGIEWAGLCMAAYNAVCCIFSFLLPRIASAIGCRLTHLVCLVWGAIGLMSLAGMHNQYLILLPMVGVGMAWASMLSLPYAMLVGSVPEEKSGLYMGIFNFFIVLPEIAAALGLGWVMVHLLHENRLAAVVMGGGFMLIAALLTLRVEEIGVE